MALTRAQARRHLGTPSGMMAVGHRTLIWKLDSNGRLDGWPKDVLHRTDEEVHFDEPCARLIPGFYDEEKS